MSVNTLASSGWQPTRLGRLQGIGGRPPTSKIFTFGPAAQRGKIASVYTLALLATIENSQMAMCVFLPIRCTTPNAHNVRM